MEAINDTPVSLDNPHLRVDIRIDLAKAFELLTENQHFVMELTIQGYKDQEIADLLHITVGAIRQLRARARRRLKNFFKD